MRIIRRHPPAHCPGEIGQAPAADPGRPVGRQVGRRDPAVWGGERRRAGIGLTAMLAVAVALIAAGRAGEVGAARHRIRGTNAPRDGKQQRKGRERRPYFLSSSRNFAWQAPQPFFPISAKAVCMFALSPLLTATSSTSALAAAVSRCARKSFQSLHTSGFGAYLPSGFGPPVPGGNTSGNFCIVSIRSVAPVVALARSFLSSM